MCGAQIIKRREFLKLKISHIVILIEVEGFIPLMVCAKGRKYKSVYTPHSISMISCKA